MNRTSILLFLLVTSFSSFSQVADSVALENVTVSSIRALNLDPLTFQNIKSSDLKYANLGQDPSSLLERLSPSILSYSDAGPAIGNYVQFRMRGIDQTRMNITLNGVPLNDMVDQGVFFSNFSDFSSGIENIQVQRGVGSSSNGVAAYGGAVNFLSEHIFEDESSLSLDILRGSFNTSRYSAKIKTGLGDDGWAAFGRMSKTTSDGYKTHSGSDSYSLFFSGGHKSDNGVLKITAFAGKTQNDQSYLPVLLSDINVDPKTNYNHPNDVDDFEQELIQIQYGRDIGSNWTTSNTVYYGSARGVFPFGLTDNLQLNFGLENKHVGLISNWSRNANRWNLDLGLHAYHFDRENFNFTSPNNSNPDYIDQTGKNEVALFSKYRYDLGATQFYADLQLRNVSLNFEADQILSFGGPVPSGPFTHERSWTFFNARFGLSHMISNQIALYGSFGRTGREPTRTDILQGDGSSINEFNIFSLEDPEIVRAEYVNDLELGMRYTSKKLDLSANIFHMTFDNEIAQVGALALRSYVAIRQNVDNSYRSGLELSTSYLASPKISLALNTSVLFSNVESFTSNGEEYNDVEHVFMPRIIASPGVLIQATDDLSFSLQGRYASSSFMELSNDQAFELPGYFVGNLQADFILTKNTALRLNFNNIFNAQYFNDGAPVDLDFDGVVEGPGYRIQAPRHFYLALRVEI